MSVDVRNRLLFECDIVSVDVLRWFDDNAIDDRTLPLLTDAHLLLVQPPLPLGARLRLLNAIHAHFHTNPNPTLAPATPSAPSAAAPPAPAATPSVSVMARLLAVIVTVLWLPWRLVTLVARLFLPVARFCWRYAALFVTLLFFAALGFVGGVALHKDLTAYAFQFGNVAVFGSWYAIIVAFAVIAVGSLIWTHHIWLYFALDESSWIFGDPKLHRAQREAAEKKSKAD
jgi:hypothetical protein